MVCIYCQQDTKVTNSRLQKRTNSIWRRRSCQNCGEVFTSLEQADLATTLRVQNGTQLTPFDRDTLFISIYESCRHRSKPLEDATALTRTITGNILKTAANGLIERDSIVTHVATVLHNFDTSAATMYLAFHPEH